MKILITAPTCGIGYGYLAGEKVDCNEAFGKELIEQGYASEITDSPVSLPEDLPGREAFIAAGMLDIDSIKEVTDLTQIAGIGAVTAEKVIAYLAK